MWINLICSDVTSNKLEIEKITAITQYTAFNIIDSGQIIKFAYNSPKCQKKKRKSLTCRTQRLSDEEKAKHRSYNKTYKLQKKNEKLQKENNKLRKEIKNPSHQDPSPLPKPSADSPTFTHKERILFDSLLPSLSNFIFMLTIFLVTVMSVPMKKLELAMKGQINNHRSFKSKQHQ